MSSIVYFTREISPSSLCKIYQALSSYLPYPVGVKISTGEPGGHNYLKPELIKDLVTMVNGTIVECNTAYDGKRKSTSDHRQTLIAHGFTKIAECDIMDSEGYKAIPIVNGKNIIYDYVGTHIDNYKAFIVLSHFKGHNMGGFGGALKNLAIGFASSKGKTHIHTSGTSENF